ncbi:MAG: DUF86 domain-containing protein [Acetobacteraceae bacterium]|nr:DUF86 domain-containing protein [Acetobacteraceae bacterium]
MTQFSSNAAKHLWDARRCAEKIARFTAGKSFDDYLEDDLLRSGVERQFEIIGEAFSGLRRTDPALAATIPDLSRIVAFRNVLIHGYASIDDQLVWEVVENDLPGLLATLAGLVPDAEQNKPRP